MGPHLRSRANLRTSPKRHYVDPSLAVAALGAGPDRLLADLNLLGLLFESLVIRDLRVLAQPLDGQVFHYRDNYGVEVDAIVQLTDGRWAGFEVKLGAGLVDDGATSLLRFREAIDTDRTGEPAVLGVIAGTGYSYVRPDGIAVKAPRFSKASSYSCRIPADPPTAEWTWTGTLPSPPPLAPLMG